MKRKAPIVIILAALVVLTVRWDFAYPPAWDQIHVGMTRQEVYERIGPGVGEWRGSKGPFWSDSGIVWHQLEVSFTGDKVTFINLNRYIGAHHPMSNVRHEQ
jgi:hypothetical protein